MGLQCKVRQAGDVSLLDLKGQFILAMRKGEPGDVQILEVVRDLMEAGSKKIVLNFSGITLMDSAGVGQLIGALTSARNRGGQIKLLKPTNEVRKVLELTQLTKVFEVHESEERAVQAFAPGAGT
jgi:anti-sigma B factor antagonist